MTYMHLYLAVCVSGIMYFYVNNWMNFGGFGFIKCFQKIIKTILLLIIYTIAGIFDFSNVS